MVKKVILVAALMAMSFSLGLGLKQVLTGPQVPADYHYEQLSQVTHQVELASAEISALGCRVKELGWEVEGLSIKLEIAGTAVVELADRNYELRCTNYELRKSGKLRYFESTDELEAFLEESDVDRHIYIPAGQDLRTYDCEDYAIALQRQAQEAGYQVNFQVVENYRMPNGQLRASHALNSTIISNEVYFIEPQTDEYWLAARLD